MARRLIVIFSSSCNWIPQDLNLWRDKTAICKDITRAILNSHLGFFRNAMSAEHPHSHYDVCRWGKALVKAVPREKFDTCWGGQSKKVVVTEQGMLQEIFVALFDGKGEPHVLFA